MVDIRKKVANKYGVKNYIFVDKMGDEYIMGIYSCKYIAKINKWSGR